jgi:hypothetical protein
MTKTELVFVLKVRRPCVYRTIFLAGRPSRGVSALGQKQTYAVHNGMSALPPIATAKATCCNGDVCFTP